MGTDKTFGRVLSAVADSAIRFDELCAMLERLGFQKRVKGSHHIFRRPGISEMINLQRDGNHAKPYQIKQVRAVILNNRIGMD